MTRSLRLLPALVLLVVARGAQAGDDDAWLKASTKACSEGAVASACRCGGSKVASGYCCTGAAQSAACPLVLARFIAPGCIASGTVVDGVTVTISRAGVSSYIDNNGALQDCAANSAVVTGWGAVGQASRTNLYASPEAAAGQTITIGSTGYYTASLWGAGSITYTAGTATMTGLPCTVRQGFPCTWNVTGTGNITAGAPSGAVTFAQFEAGQWDTLPVRSGTRAAEYVTFTPNSITDGSTWSVAADVVVQGAGRAWATGNATILQPGAASGANRAYLTGSYWSVNDNAGTQKYVSLTVPQTSAIAHVVGNTVAGTLSLDTNGTDRAGSITGAGAGTWGTPPTSTSIGGSVTAGAWYVRNVATCQGASARTDCAAERPDPYAIGCFGDSLTVGASGGTAFPFPQRLTYALGPPWTAWNYGVNGYRSDQIAAVLSSRLVAGRYGAVIILGGINDVSQGYDTSHIYDRLVAMYAQVRALGIPVVPTTILPARGTAWWTEPATRTLVEGVNTSIASYSDSNSIVWVDAYNSFADPGNAGALLAAYDGADHLHVNQAGTDLLARLYSAARKGTACGAGAISSPCVCGYRATSVGYCCSGTWQATACTLIDEDANTVAHVYWNGTALVDTKGNAWSMAGTVPQVAASGLTPAGAGNFSDANYYYLDPLGTGSDVLDFSGNFLATMVVGNPGESNVVYGNGAYQARGIYLQASKAANALDLFVSNNGSVGSVRATGTWGALNVLCWGRSGSTFYARLNDGTTASGTPAYAGATVKIARIGRYDTAGNSTATKIYEVYWTTTAASDAACTALVDSVQARLGI